MTHEHRYTFEQAAGRIGVADDDLPAILRSIGIDPDDPARERSTLSSDEVARLDHFKKGIEQTHEEGTDKGVDD